MSATATRCLVSLLVTLVVGCTTTPPVAVIEASPLSVSVGNPVQLSGTQSSDPDGDPLTYDWSVTAHPAGSTADVAEPTTNTTSFTPDVPGSYTISLVVSDTSNAVSQPATTNVEATSALVLVPDVLAKTQAQATDAISGANLVLGTVSQANSNAVPQGNVISQNPSAGVSVGQGTAVDLVISLGPATPPPVSGVSLEGPPEAPALSALYDLDLLLTLDPPVTETDLNGVTFVRTRFFLGLKDTARVGEVNTLLTEINGRITGMGAGVPWIIVDIPDPGSRAAFDTVLAQVAQNPVTEYIVPDALLTTDVLPGPYDPSTLVAFEHLDHLIAAGVPAAWNARRALVDTPVMAPLLLVADDFGDGPPRYRPFGFDVSENDYITGRWDAHGYYVLSILGADFGEGRVTGLLPTGDYRPQLRAVDLTRWRVRDPSNPDKWIDEATFSDVLINIQTRITSILWPNDMPPVDRRIILSTSLGFDCGSAMESAVYCSDNPSGYQFPTSLGRIWMAWVYGKNLETRLLHATSAGNDAQIGVPATLHSPWNAAALLNISPFAVPLRNTLVVGSVVAENTPPYRVICSANYSNQGGNIAAVGTKVSGYPHPYDGQLQIDSPSGTSMSTPQVAALGYYVWALDDHLTAIDVTQKLINNARTVAPEDVDPTIDAACNQTRTNLEPVINAYGTLLSVDKPTALTDTGSPSDAPVRSAILDVANSSAVEGRDGAFDQGDLTLLKDKVLPSVGEVPAQCSGYDWSRYDLSGNGHADAERGNRFNLDISKPAAWTYVTAPDDSEMHFNESCATDLQVMCYYAYSPLYTGSAVERDNLLHPYCEHGQKTWRAWPEVGTRPKQIMLGMDGRGSIYAAWLEVDPDQGYLATSLDVGKVESGGISSLGVFTVPGVVTGYETVNFGSIRNFFVDKSGNMVVAYEVETGIWCQPGMVVGVDCGTTNTAWVRRYNVDRGWDAKPAQLENIYYGSVDSVQIAGDSCSDTMIVWSVKEGADTFLVRAIKYDVNLGWQTATDIAAVKLGSDPFPKIVMNRAGNAIVVWRDQDPADGSLEIRVRRYRVSSGWEADSRRIASLDPSFPATGQGPDLVMDSRGNAIVTWHDYKNIWAKHFSVDGGWQGVEKVVDNASAMSPTRALRYLVSMDECGNAMLVFLKDDAGQLSLLSKQYHPEQGWDETGEIIAQGFDEYLAALSLHGGGNATLVSGISYFGALAPDPYCWTKRTNAFARRYRAGVGWDEPTMYTTDSPICTAVAHDPPEVGWSPVHYPLSASAADQYGNAAAVILPDWAPYTYGDYLTIPNIQMMRFE